MLIALREPVFVFRRVGGGRGKALVGPKGSSFTPRNGLLAQPGGIPVKPH